MCRWYLDDIFPDELISHLERAHAASMSRWADREARRANEMAVLMQTTTNTPQRTTISKPPLKRPRPGKESKK